jgi:hypothetical protein
MLIAHILLFMACWGPKLLWDVALKATSQFDFSREMYEARVFLFLLPFVHASSNPILHFCMSSTLRESFKKLLTRKRRYNWVDMHQHEQNVPNGPSGFLDTPKQMTTRLTNFPVDHSAQSVCWMLNTSLAEYAIYALANCCIFFFIRWTQFHDAKYKYMLKQNV